MGIKYPVGVGTVLLCDYSRGGFQPPEMVKRRPAVVISPRLPYRDGLCTVIPLSQDEPDRDLDYVARIDFGNALPHPFPYTVFWAKCDMIATVSFERLDLFHTSRDQSGKRKYLHPKMTAEDIVRVRACVLKAIGL
jgi:uncharacterized protein YifN (PemK superfamily)